MTRFEFTLILPDPPRDEPAWDRLYGRCKDATLTISGGVGRLAFDREAATLDEAMRSAVADVEAEGVEIERVELERDALAVA